MREVDEIIKGFVNKKADEYAENSNNSYEEKVAYRSGLLDGMCTILAVFSDVKEVLND